MRADPQRLDAAIAIYLDTSGLAPTDRRPMERLAKAHLARAYGYPGSHADDLVVSREFALACLLTRSAFAGRVQIGGGRVTLEAVSTLDAADAECATYAAMSWARWLQARGVAGLALDLDAIEVLARRAAELDPRVGDGLPYQALGLALSLPPTPLGPDLAAAGMAFQRARELGPTQLTPLVDLALTVHAPGGELERWAEVLREVTETPQPSDDPWLMENRRARQRAHDALAGGAPPPGRWY